jgi:RNA-directed DNA polymerase
MPVRANDPEDKVRELQRRLWTCAKRSKTRRFHALYDRIYRSDVLWEAWQRVKANRGAAGVDQQTLADIEAGGVEQFLSSIQETLRAGEYRAQPVRRRYILKADGKQQRPLGIPTVRDRVVQMAAKLVVEPIFEADFLACSYGFRPKRSATQALEAIRQAGNRGHNFVVDADIRAYFDSIDQGKLMVMLEKRISDRRVLKLLRKWLEAGVMEDGMLRSALAGTPQGGVISPLLANIYLHELDRIWSAKCNALGVLVRYADDFVIMCRTRTRAREALRRVGVIMQRLGLELHPEKTKLVELSAGKEQFEFLGCSIRKRRSVQRMPNRHFMQRWPSPKAMKRLRQRVHELTDVRCTGARDVKDVIASLNPVLRGWGYYFRTGNADREFNRIDTYVDERLRRWHWRSGGQRARHASLAWSRDRHHGLGLYRLRGTVRYPVQAMPIRPSLSRVQATCTHGLKGGAGIAVH